MEVHKMGNLVRISHCQLNATLEILGKVGVTQEHFKRVRSSRKYAKAVASAFLGDDGAMMNYDDVRAILGKDFISPEEIAKARKIVYGDDLLAHFARTVPSEKVIRWLRENGFVLMAGPPKPLSLLEIRDINAQLFYSKEGGWYANERERFSRDDKVAPEWLMLRKGIFPDSMRKNWDEQRALLSEFEAEYIPNAPEVAWGITTYKEVRNVWLLPDIYARTSSADSGGFRVDLGDSAVGGVFVSLYWSAIGGLLGLSSARKLEI